MPQRHSRSNTRAVVIAVVVGVGLVGGVLAFRAHSAGSGDGSPSASASAEMALEALLAASASPDAVDLSQPRGQILTKPTLADAMSVARPLMVNTSGRLDTGSALFSLWAAEHLTWDALDALPATSPALFRKDPDAERGKRFCIAGVVVDIRAEKSLAGRLVDDRSLPLIGASGTTGGGMGMGMGMGAGMGMGMGTAAPTASAAPTDSAGAMGAFPQLDTLGAKEDWDIAKGGKVYFATLKEKVEPTTEAVSARETTRRTLAKDPLVVELIAVRSTGSLVDGSDARACGVLTGVTLPPASGSAAGTDGPQHRIVGMFDLPENHGGQPARAGG